MSMKNFAVPDIVRGEHRTIELRFPTDPTTAEQSSEYRLGFAKSRDAADILSINFGVSEYQPDEKSWLVTLTPTQTLLLSVGTVFVDVWDRSTLARKALSANVLTVGNLAGTPT
jgi:hypothetical protein